MNDIDFAQQMEERERDAIVAKRQRVHLGATDRTVRPGECIDCHQPIPTERLRARPDATRCIECEDFAQEARERFFRRGKR